MACEDCYKINNSYSEHPFVPPFGSVDDKTYVCRCGQKWWQFNDHFHLWSMVNDNSTFENIQAGCPEPVAIGNPSINLDKILSKDDSSD